jgi:hypothetical protein
MGGGEERERNEKNIFGPKNKTRKDRRRLRHEISIYYGGERGERGERNTVREPTFLKLI